MDIRPCCGPFYVITLNTNTMKYKTRLYDNNKNPLLGSDSLLYIDGRWNMATIKRKIKAHEKSLLKIKPYFKVSYFTICSNLWHEGMLHKM